MTKAYKHRQQTSASALAKRQSGFSIFELMIALMLGLVVVSGIVQLFSGNSRTYDLVNAQSRVQENARFAVQFLARDLRMADWAECVTEDSLDDAGFDDIHPVYAGRKVSASPAIPLAEAPIQFRPTPGTSSTTNPSSPSSGVKKPTGPTSACGWAIPLR